MKILDMPRLRAASISEIESPIIMLLAAEALGKSRTPEERALVRFAAIAFVFIMWAKIEGVYACTMLFEVLLQLLVQVNYVGAVYKQAQYRAGW